MIARYKPKQAPLPSTPPIDKPAQLSPDIRKLVEVLIDPETNAPFKLLPAECEFLALAFETGADGRLIYPEQVYAAPKKSGKTTFAALHMLIALILFGGRYAEGYAVANDLEQAQSRVFAMVRRIVEASPLLRRECKTTADKITYLPTLATIVPLASDYASAAGGHPTITVFDELWAYTSERSRRLWDEMCVVPTRKISLRLTVTYAGFEGESELLHDLYKRGIQQPEVAPNLRAGDGLLMFWSHEPVAPWQDERWLAEMRRSLRPNQYLRMIENRFVSSESTFVDMPSWDACVDATLGTLPFSHSASIWVGIDASVKRDSTAVVAVTWDRTTQKVRLAWHRVFQPSAERPLDFEMTIEQSLIELRRRFQIKKVYFDPYQMQATAQRLARERLPIEEFPQTVGNLTEASQNLFELIKSRSLVAYPDEAMRRSIAQAVAVETTRGWRIAKDKQSHKIDVVVALAQACLAVIREQRTHTYDTSLSWVSGPDEATEKPDYAAERLKAFIRSNTLFF
ncbi:MAG: terminase large subunit [Xanthobacteraceae bacterium]